MTLSRVLSLAAVLAFTWTAGCGSGDDGEPQMLTGQFSAKAVSGIAYSTNSQDGVTNERGEFQYIEGEIVSFSIGELIFPDVAAAPVVTPLDMSESRLINDEVVVNVSTLLLTLDDDGNADNGIVISPRVAIVATPIDFFVSVNEFRQDGNVNNLIANAGATRDTLVSPEEAITSLETDLVTADRFRWVDLPRVIATGLIGTDCVVSGFIDSASVIASGTYDNVLREPGAEQGEDEVDQVTGDASNLNELTTALNRAGFHYVCLLTSEDKRQEIVDYLDYFASRDLLQRNTSNVQISATMFYVSISAMQMWGAIEPYTAIAPERAERIESWLSRRMAEIAPIERNREEDCTSGELYNDNCGNFGVAAAHAIMLHGAVTGDVDNYRYGVNRYRDFLSAFRADGSFPEDARRGCRALLYSTYSIASMAAIAEIGLAYGTDLYKEGANGVTLSDGARFLIAVKDDNSLIVPYASVDGRMDPSNRDGCPGGTEGRQVRQTWTDFAPLWQWVLRHPDDAVAQRVEDNLPQQTRAAMFGDTGNIPYLWTMFPGWQAR